MRVWKVQPGEEIDSFGGGMGGVGGVESALNIVARDAESEDARWSVVGVVKVEHKFVHVNSCSEDTDADAPWLRQVSCE